MTRTVSTRLLHITDRLYVKKYWSFCLWVVMFATNILPFKWETWDLSFKLVNI